MVARKDDNKKKSKKGGASLNEEDYFAKMNEEALKKILKQPEDKDTEKAEE